MTLDDLPLGGVAKVVRVDGDPGFRLRLMEIGFTPGTPVKRVGQAPLGDPLAYRIRGTVISLRAVDAAMIVVEQNEGKV